MSCIASLSSKIINRREIGCLHLPQIYADRNEQLCQVLFTNPVIIIFNKLEICGDYPLNALLWCD